MNPNKGNDKVFIVTSRAKEAIAKYGQENVVNATIGVLYDENESLVTFDTVAENYRKLSNEELFAYAPAIDGTPTYKEAVKQLVFGKDYKENFKGHHFEAVATAGGTGAIRNSLQNYLNPGEKVLLPELMWAPYMLMPKAIGADFDTYKLFNSEDKFDLDSLKSKVEELAKVQKNVVLLINDPCHNPTGYTLKIDEWKAILDFLQEVAKDKPVVLLIDIAYTEFSNRDVVKFRELFKNLNENLLPIFLFSMSKSLTCYGLRTGAQVAITTSEEVIEDFGFKNKMSCRVTWSNTPRSAMALLSNVILDDENYSSFKAEVEKYKNLLLERAEIFLKEAKEVNLVHYPYDGGFFITLPVEGDLDELTAKLEKQNIFTVPLENSLRIAVSSLPVRKMYGLAAKIKEAL